VYRIQLDNTVFEGENAVYLIDADQTTLVDTAVAEPHQGRGIGTAMVDAVVRWIRTTAPDGAYVDLLADVDGFYERWGFEGTAPASRAMGVRSESLQPIRPPDG